VTRQITVSGETHALLCRIAATLTAETGRAVTFDEVIGHLIEGAAPAGGGGV
jgi:hypothetical protein